MSEETKNSDMTSSVVENSTKHTFDLFKSQENIDIVTSYAFWSRFQAILIFVLAGLTILVGIPLLLLFGLGILYIAIGSLYIYVGVLIIQTSQQVKELENCDTQEQFNNGVLNALSLGRNATRVVVIMAISFIFLAVIGIFMTFSLFSNVSNDRIINDRYQPTIYK